MQSSPPPPPAALPPRRRLGRRFTRVPAIILTTGACIVGAAVLYTMHEKSLDDQRARQLAQAPPSGADASGVLSGAPNGFIAAAATPVAHPSADARTEERKTEHKNQGKTEEDNGREKARQAAWVRYWAEREQLRKQGFDKRLEALTTLKTSVEASSGSHGAPTTAAAEPPAVPQVPSGHHGGMNSWWGGGGSPGGGGFYPGLGAAPQIDREGQEQKLAFAGQQGDLGKNDIVPTTRRPPIPNAVLAGTYIKMASENVVGSDVPGSALGRVTESVYNTSDGTCVMIPQNSKIIGRVNTVVSTGQTRVPGYMTRIIFPDGSAQPIGAQQVADNAGEAGWEDEVDRHLLLKFGSAAVAGMFGAAIQLSVPQGSRYGSGYDPQQVIGSSLGQQMGQLGQQMAQQNLSIPNTLRIRQHYPYTIILDKDLIIPPWSCEGGTSSASLMPIMSVNR